MLLDHLVKNGSDRVVQQCRDNISSIHALKDFQFIDKDGRDQGANGELHASMIKLLNAVGYS